MDTKRSGALIKKLRTEQGYTQLQLAELLSVSDKTVSKWERGLGFPEISLLPKLCKALNIEMSRLIDGCLFRNRPDAGKMENLRFYVCPVCNNLLFSSETADLSCCGRKLIPLMAKPCDSRHEPHTETVETDSYITLSHPMSKEHYLLFAAAVTDDHVTTIRLYPEQEAAFRFEKRYLHTLYFYCTKDGLYKKTM